MNHRAHCQYNHESSESTTHDRSASIPDTSTDSDTAIFYSDNPRYDSLDACNDWAKISLELHESDVRPVLYSAQELEEARTHDDLWNAAQLQMTSLGKMHVRFNE